MQLILGLVNFGVLLIFGVVISATFSGVILDRKNIGILSGLCVLLLILQSFSYALVGFEQTQELYPLICHLPIVLFLTLYYKRSFSFSLFAVMAAYLLCQISKWTGILGLEFLDKQWVSYLIQIIVNIVIGILVVRYLAPQFKSILTKPTRIVYIFNILPLTYYLFDYIATVYTDLLYEGRLLVFEFLPFILAIAYVFFLVLYFREYEQKNELEIQNQFISIQAAQSQKEVQAIRHSAYETSILRHDMRHHLQNIYSDITNENYEHALKYIQNTIAIVDAAGVRRFCQNELLNTVLSYYNGIMEQKGIQFELTVLTDENLPCSEQEFTSILSNGLENAIHAVMELPDYKRIVTLLLKSEGNKVLLSISNPYLIAPTFVDGMPVTDKDGHGLGTQSIRYITQKLKGNFQFTAKDGTFTLKVVLNTPIK